MAVVLLILAGLAGKRRWFGTEVTHRSVTVGTYTLYLKSKQRLVYADALVDVVNSRTGASERQVLGEVDYASDVAHWPLTVVDPEHVVVGDGYVITLRSVPRSAHLDAGRGRADTGSGSMTQLYQPETPIPADAVYRVVQTDVRPALLLPGHHAAWDTAEPITWGPPRAKTTFRALWNAQGLAMRFDVCDEKPWHTMTKRDQPIWEEEVVEIFLDPTRTGRDYLEVEISPINVVTDLKIRHPWPGLDNDITWDWAGLESTVIPGSCEGMQPGSWVAIAWMPWAALENVSPEVAAVSPPKAGDRWKFNVFRIKRPNGPADPKRDAIFAAWSAPDGPSFHAPAFFKDFVF